MAHCIFIHRSDSIYDDSPAEQYQFPKSYLKRASACIGDWIVYYEPRKIANTRGYFAVARVSSIIPDPSASEMYVAVIEAGSYLDFANPVPFRIDGQLTERGLSSVAGSVSGRAQAAIRPLADGDFIRIVQLGLASGGALLPRDPIEVPGFQEESEPFIFEQDRSRSEFLSSRLVRDRTFRQVVLRAYDSRCAITGLKLINGGGRAEVEAAHIRPVEENGPDTVKNGIALSGTVHWMFDRGLIGLEDDMRILISRHVNDEVGVRAMMYADGFARAPVQSAFRPHPRFLEWHRKERFKT